MIQTLTLKTNLRGEENTYTELFGIVDRASMVRRNSLERRHGGALLGCSVVLSSWIQEALEARRVLTLHGDYFRLRQPLERAVYQLVRKHCGEQPEWRVGLPRLQAKVGSSRQRRDFRGEIRKLASRWDGQDFLGLPDRVRGRHADRLPRRGRTARTRRPDPSRAPHLCGDPGHPGPRTPASRPRTYGAPLAVMGGQEDGARAERASRLPRLLPPLRGAPRRW